MAILTHNEVLHLPRIAALMRWIDSHDRPYPTQYSTDDGTLTVHSLYTDADGKVHDTNDVIECSHEAARAVLGY